MEGGATLGLCGLLLPDIHLWILQDIYPSAGKHGTWSKFNRVGLSNSFSE
jgi:hypothetical protein